MTFSKINVFILYMYVDRFNIFVVFTFTDDLYSNELFCFVVLLINHWEILRLDVTHNCIEVPRQF